MFMMSLLCLCSGEKLVNERMTKAAENVREHILKGCVHDPDPHKVQLFHLCGRTKDGLDKVRSTRGSNRVESYHRLLRNLLGSFNTSPLMAHYTLLLYNYRRNHRMAGMSSLCRLHHLSSTFHRAQRQTDNSYR